MANPTARFKGGPCRAISLISCPGDTRAGVCGCGKGKINQTTKKGATDQPLRLLAKE